MDCADSSLKICYSDLHYMLEVGAGFQLDIFTPYRWAM